MKQIFLGSLIGILIVFALDTFLRLFISLTAGTELSVMGYGAYPFFWKIVLSLLTLVTTFLGAYFSLTYVKRKHAFVITSFGLLIVAIRYSQIHFSIGIESLIYPISALIFSLLGTWLAWKWLHRKGKIDKEVKRHHHQTEEV